MAASIGNVLEYGYDFVVVYAFLAAIIAKNFFPNESEVALAARRTFAVLSASVFWPRPHWVG